ncbi:ATP-binding cassette domain-containing protein [Pelagibaculum spongiae]|uniref:ABC transporter domain-containing protein n=1 Tax=Pelagibaculum spongiae TaxID=2080658 RepID=A0A2V1GZW7_9GAMM|nr:ATP-binding cassette domain-containing protein [Pelagibaculum spongiae]PVZ72286.1 hypothetical protein DC094_04540 [Pelagibaculum spongiae]
MLQIKQLQVLRDQKLLKYDFQLQQGKTLAVQGLSGVGKSTLLQVIAGFVAAEKGSVLWHGQSLLELPVEQRPVSYLFQQNNLFEHLSVIQNLMLGFADDTDQDQLLDKLVNAAIELQVDKQLEKKPTELSGGQRQRIAIIRTLLRPEPIILLDEPFAELDPTTRSLATQWVADIAKQQNKTILMVTHQSEDVQQLADEILQLQ